MVVSPNNPTGTVQSPELLRNLADLAIRHNLLVISDEIYERIVYDDQAHLSLASCAGMRERTITINGSPRHIR